MKHSAQKGSDRGPNAAKGGAGTGVRLQRVLAEAGVASRRACEALIEAGDVEVNGVVRAKLPVFVDPQKDRITVRGDEVKTARHERGGRGGGGGGAGGKVYVLLHKPDNCLVTTADDEGGGGEERETPDGKPAPTGVRRTVMDLVEHPSGARLFPVGRLDFHSSGLLLLTNDGELAHRLTHAKFGVKKVYRVAVKHTPTPEILDALRRMACPKPETDPTTGRVRDPLRVVGETDAGVALEIVAREGKTRSLRDVMARLGLKVRKITRVRLGPLSLIGVRSSTWRDLSSEEVVMLKESVGLAAPGSSRAKARPGKGRPGMREGGGGGGAAGGRRGRPGGRVPQRLRPPVDRR